MRTIVYLHGFISAPGSRKATMLRDYVERCVEGIELVVPALHHRPVRAIEQVEKACARVASADLTLVGSSLGGFYATVMAERLGCRAAVINPAVHPHTHFPRYLGPQKNLYTGEEFVLTQAHVDDLAAMDPPAITRPSRYWLLAETGDEVLDYREAVAYYAGACQTVIQGGDHALQTFPEHIPDLVDWGSSREAHRRMKQVMFEEDGAFRVGTILAEAGGSFQVEAAHGKRSKVKATAILLRFDGQSLSPFMQEAQKIADGIDPQFLWEVCGRDEFGFDALAQEYFGRAPSPHEAAAVALALHSNPVFFYKRGKGRYQAAAEENLKAALAGIEKKRKQQEQVDAWAAELAAGRVPEPIATRVDTLLFKPDKMSLEWRALDQAATEAGLAPPRLLAKAGAIAGPEDFMLRRFAFEFFPKGLGFADIAEPLTEPAALDESPAAAFSIDDAETTEIDDAFSVQRLDGIVRVGVHIAAPSLFFGRGHPLEAFARERLSTVYFPGGKITMLPEGAVEQATLAAGRSVPAASLYLDLDPASLEVRATESRLERVRIVDNLRLAELDTRLNAEAVARGHVEGPHGDDLMLLWKFARLLKAARGAADEKADRPDYTIRVADGRVAIELRHRGTPVDTVVSELMIHVNATWGKWLADRGYDAIYRNQKGARTRMEVQPAAHEWLGVSHYAWASSPLRRFSDLANQRQLAAALRGEAPAYTRDELAAAARDFDTAYEAYNEHQRLLERYWVLRYLQQEGIEEAWGAIIREELVRIEGLPLVVRCVGLPASAPGERVKVVFGEADLWEAHVLARYGGK